MDTLQEHHRDPEKVSRSVSEEKRTQAIATRERSVSKLVRCFPCPGCHRVFRARSALLGHEGMHEDPRPFLCEDCPRGYPTERLLIKHEKRHFKHKPYKCEDCGKKYREKLQLRYHTRDLHSGVKAYACKQCGETFFLAIQRYVHTIRTHTEAGRALEREREQRRQQRQQRRDQQQQSGTVEAGERSGPRLRSRPSAEDKTAKSKAAERRAPQAKKALAVNERRPRGRPRKAK